ncbi:MAG TPA: hypothetical protein VFZ58_01650 [Candidatus Saccharimonadales bacterium]
MSLVYDPRRYLVGSGAQKQLEEVIAKYTRQLRVWLGLALATLVSLLSFGAWLMRHDQSLYTADDRVRLTVGLTGILLCMIASIGYSLIVKADLKYIRSNPADYACSKRWQGAQFIANVTPDKLTCKLPQSPPGASHQTPAEACRSALNRLLELHTQCVKPLPSLADAYLSAFFESQKTCSRLDYLWDLWNQKGRSKDNNSIFSNERLAERIIEASQGLLEVAKAIQETANQFESTFAISANDTSPTTTSQGA